MEKYLFTQVEAATLTGMSRSRIYELMAAGELQSVTIGRSRRISRTALEDFARVLERRQPAPGRRAPQAR